MQSSASRFDGVRPHYLLAAFIVFVFLVGGSARADVTSLIVLRPAAALLCGFALLTLTPEQASPYRGLFAFAGAAVLLTALHLVPLPYSAWSALPGRRIIVEADRIAGLGNLWRPLSMVPQGSWNALYSLLVPLAALLLASQLRPRDRLILLVAFLVAGALSGILAFLQIAGATNGPAYLYRITNSGSAVGLFANRNHTAAFLACLFPMLAIYAADVQSREQRRFRAGISVAAAIVLIPLLLVTGSRSGIVLGMAGLASTLFLYPLRGSTRHRPGDRKRIRLGWPILAGLGAIAGLTLVFILFSRAQAVERLFALDDDLRFRVWGPIVQMGWSYFPFGSGIGSFVETYQIAEPDALLRPSYLNHAHNDWLEIFATGGLPAVLLLAVAVIAFLRRSWTVWVRFDRRDVAVSYARMGSVILLLLGVASVTDYPLRTPSIAVLAMVAAVWLYGRPAHRDGK